ncbi:MAG: ribonuclease P protein component 4 [Methanomassiliicoccales archaeon]|nr:MAG: ribonuclease P protein component 4 [Methanomassiliicoccales archaeon]
MKSLAWTEAYDGALERSRRYNDLARRIAMRCQISMPYNLDVCKECHVSLVPGRTCRVRIGPQRVIVQCTQCGSYRRIPYLKEKRRKSRCQGQKRT